MSKKLLKILAICIFVTLIPVAIVGIAMAATLSAPFTVTVQLKGEVESLSEYNKSLTLTVNNNQKNSLSVGVKSDDKVTISFEGEAYDVKGFYEGGSTAVNEESKPLASKVSSYTFNVNGDRTISVWIEPKTFNITFEGNETTSVLTYGDELSIIEDDTEFRGWTIKTAPAGVTINDTVYNYATFPVSGDYTLSPSYAKYMEFHYFVRDEEVAVEKVEKSNYGDYQFLTADEINEKVGAGYSFVGWAESADLLKEISQLPEFTVGSYNVYAMLDLITFNIDVKFNANSNQVDQLSFNIQDGFGQYAATRPNYNLVGFNYNSDEFIVNEEKTNYTNSEKGNLSVVIAEEFKNRDGLLTGKDIVIDTEIEVTAVWSNAYSDKVYTFKFYTSSLRGDVYGKNGENIEQIAPLGTITLSFNDFVSEDGSYEYFADLNQSLFDFYLGKYSEFYVNSEGSISTSKYSFQVAVGGDEPQGAISIGAEEDASNKEEDKLTFFELLQLSTVTENEGTIHIIFNFD